MTLRVREGGGMPACVSLRAAETEGEFPYLLRLTYQEMDVLSYVSAHSNKFKLPVKWHLHRQVRRNNSSRSNGVCLRLLTCKLTFSTQTPSAGLILLCTTPIHPSVWHAAHSDLSPSNM